LKGLTRFTALLVMPITLGAPAAARPQTTGAGEVAVRARAFQPGELVAVTAVVPNAVEGLRVRALGHTSPAFWVDEHRWEALVGIDLSVAPGKYTVSVEGADGRRLGQTTMTVTSKAFPTRRLTVDPAFVDPPPAALERIERENNDLAAVWKNAASERLWSDAFVAPVAEQATSSFGARSVFNGQARTPHSGADFPSPAGTPIHAPNSGRVVLAHELYFTGNTIVIDHGLGLFSLLAHLSSFAVHEGDQVEAGQIVGAVGATGRVTGPHLHWAVRANDARVDPLSVLSLIH